MTYEELFNWWRSDASFKAPEILDSHYAMNVLADLAGLYPESRPRQLKEGEYEQVFRLLDSDDKEGMKAFLRGDE